MKSNLQFFQYESHQPSDCGEVLEIDFSAAKLDWQGVVLEKGSSPHFYPNYVYTPYFYFALALEQDLNWQVKVDDGLTALKTTPGDIWINPPQTPFSHHIDEPCHFVILAIEKQRFLTACDLNFTADKLQFLTNYNVDDPTIKGIMELFVLEVKFGGRNGKSYVDHLIALLATHYIHHYSNFIDLQHQRANRSKFDLQQVDKVDEYIETHIGEPIAVDDLADLLKCSKFYFLREFKKLMGITPYQYLVNKRLAQAKSQLLKPDANIAAIALGLGFNDQSHFTRSFKNQFGMTPGNFIKNQ